MFENAKHEGYADDDVKCGSKDDVPVPTLLVLAGEPVQRTTVHHMWSEKKMNHGPSIIEAELCTYASLNLAIILENG